MASKKQQNYVILENSLLLIYKKKICSFINKTEQRPVTTLQKSKNLCKTFSEQQPQF